MKNLFPILTLAATLSLSAQEATTERPTLEQLMMTNKAVIAFELARDENNYDVHAWQNIVTAVSALVEYCQSMPQGDHSPELFQEVFRVIELMRREELKSTGGLHGCLSVQVGTPGQESNK